MIVVFISYAHEDEALRQELDKHLASLKHQGLIDVWHDRRIEAGEDWANAINNSVRTAQIILLLVSIDFIASSYCYEIELQEAMRRHEAGEAIVVPVILRPCDWHDLPFGRLQAATRDGKPITKYTTRDEGFLEVVQAIKAAAKRLGARPDSVKRSSSLERKEPVPHAGQLAPRSSNLHVRKTFTDHDRDVFRIEAFEYIANFFENSLSELQIRNPQLQSQYRRRDANSFETAVYENGKQAARCGIWLSGSRFGGDISYSNTGLGNGNSYNESMSVGDDGQMPGLKPLGMASHGHRQELLTLEGAAEYYWSMFIRYLQDE